MNKKLLLAAAAAGIMTAQAADAPSVAAPAITSGSCPVMPSGLYFGLAPAFSNINTQYTVGARDGEFAPTIQSGNSGLSGVLSLGYDFIPSGKNFFAGLQLFTELTGGIKGDVFKQASMGGIRGWGVLAVATYGDYTIKSQTPVTFGAVLRMGMAFEKLLFNVNAGWECIKQKLEGDLNASFAGAAGPANYSWKAEKWLNAFRYGVGMHYAFNPKLTIGVDFNISQSKKAKVTQTGNNATVGNFAGQMKVRKTTGMLQVTYKVLTHKRG